MKRHGVKMFEKANSRFVVYIYLKNKNNKNGYRFKSMFLFFYIFHYIAYYIHLLTLKTI